MSEAGHRQIDHTADLALELWGPSEVELLSEAARAIVAIMTDGRTIGRDELRRFEISAVDREDRLVQWVNEIIFLAVTNGFLFAEAEIELQTGALLANVAGEPDAADHITGELKSATYHDLVLEERGSSWWARLVIDV